MRLTKKDLAARKEKILHVAYDLFCLNGIDSVTLAQIAKEADVGDSAIYRYFGTKSNLLWHAQKILWEEIVEQILLNVQDKLSLAKNGFEEVSVLLYGFKNLYENHSSFLLFAHAYKSYLVRNHITLSEETYSQFLKPVLEIYHSALRRGQNDGSINHNDSIEEQFFVIWGIMQCYSEQIVIYQKMYNATINPYPQRFEMVYRYTLKALENA